ncbi:CAAX amino protease [Aeromicrobium flavum]|uniref:CAAX amino protease n=1 Tax=Aeromicrobium flavum TaxID=416568 RepID=A0A512HUU9_9ACTN|nr:CPBP family intramembrane glutamic endopeptidase [Aeromicrobium flavum]GEO89205.1 CAAX amino protease [Aeromicrobium flavum]
MTRRLRAEVWIVLGLSLGQSAVYSVVSLVRKLSQGPLRDSTASLNQSRDAVPWLDLTYQLLAIGFALVPVALALYLLSLDAAPPVLRRLGLDAGRPWRDVAFGAALAAVIGIPGLGVYFGGRALGVTAEIVTSPEDLYWWTVIVLVLSAIQNAVVEEVIVVGYLMTRLRQFGWGLPAVIAASALLRGGYHLYQGFGQFVGNAAMGVVFAWWFHRTGRVMPLVIAHTILDVVAFVGYALFADQLGLR